MHKDRRTATEDPPWILMGNFNHISSHQTPPLILMSLQITNICSVSIGALCLICENITVNHIIKIQSKGLNGDLKPEHKKTTDWTTVGRTTDIDSLALTIYSRLSLSRIPRDSPKHFEISVPRNIRVAIVGKTKNRTTTFNKSICNLTPEVRDILKILWKRGEITP